MQIKSCFILKENFNKLYNYLIMKGIEVKIKLKKDGYILRNIARKLDISHQLLNSYFEVDDIKTGVLEKIAKAIDKDITYFFENKESAQIYSKNKEEKVHLPAHIPSSDDREFYTLLLKEIQAIRQANDNNQKLIEQMLTSYIKKQ